MQDSASPEHGTTPANGVISKSVSEAPASDLLVDLLGPLAIEGPPAPAISGEQTSVPGLNATPSAVDALALAILSDPSTGVQVEAFLRFVCSLKVHCIQT